MTLKNFFRQFFILALIFFPSFNGFSQSVTSYAYTIYIEGVQKMDSLDYKKSTHTLIDLNKDIANSIMQEFIALPIDRCRQNLIEVIFSVDSLSRAENINLKIGTGIAKQDSMIIAILKKSDGRWKPLQFQNRNLSFKTILVVRLNNFAEEMAKEKDDGTNSFFNNFVTRGQAGISKDCEDDTYFYEKGIEEFKKGKFKYAAQDFKLALKSNPYDLDALYNLSVSYFK